VADLGADQEGVSLLSGFFTLSKYVHLTSSSCTILPTLRARARAKGRGMHLRRVKSALLLHRTSPLPKTASPKARTDPWKQGLEGEGHLRSGASQQVGVPRGSCPSHTGLLAVPTGRAPGSAGGKGLPPTSPGPCPSLAGGHTVSLGPVTGSWTLTRFPTSLSSSSSAKALYHG